MAKCIGKIEFGYTGEELTVSVNGFTKHYPYEAWAKTIFTELKRNQDFRLERKSLSYPQLVQILEIWGIISHDDPGRIDNSKKPTIIESFQDSVYMLFDQINKREFICGFVKGGRIRNICP